MMPITIYSRISESNDYNEKYNQELARMIDKQIDFIFAIFI